MASAAAEGVGGETDAVEYPGRGWTAPSVWHGDAIGTAALVLHHYFRNRDDALVAMKLAVYYVRGDNRVWLQPDVQVVFGVGREGNRRSFKVWDEGKAPDFVLEVATPAEHDVRERAQEYLGIGVCEYWRLDPEGTVPGTPLEGYRGQGGRCDRLESVDGPGGVGWLRSEVLGLDLRGERRPGPTVLVIRDPRTGDEIDGSPETSARRRRIAAARARAVEEEFRRQRERTRAAEERERGLEQRLQDLTGQTRPRRRDS